jgi:tRNA(Ile)-lysidine synthase
MLPKTSSAAVIKVRAAVKQSTVNILQNTILPAHNLQKPLILIALSGGADSLALASAAAFENGRKNAVARYGAVIINHQLQEATNTVSEDAKQYALQNRLSPVIIIPIDVDDNHAGGMEAAAREARYEAIEKFRLETGAVAVMTGHTANDQAEQVFLGVARGSGTRSLAGIPPVRGALRRPFLNVTREETQTACDDQNIKFWSDPQNNSEEFTRVRVRKNILPTLVEQLGESVISNLCRTAQIAREDADALDWVVDTTLLPLVIVEGTQVTVKVSDVMNVPAALRNRLFRTVAEKFYNAYLTGKHVNMVTKLITDWNGQKTVNLPGVTVRRDSNAQIVFNSLLGEK